MIRIHRSVVEIIVDHARQNPSVECCGLIAGIGGAITHSFPVANVARNPATGYEIAPEEIVRCMRQMRSLGLVFLGIYHSHPKGENAPSPRDIERAYYSEEAYFILSPAPDAPRPVRAFNIREGRVAELTIEIM
jgi:proteasome lid subunit RPN8/RPN11